MPSCGLLCILELTRTGRYDAAQHPGAVMVVQLAGAACTSVREDASVSGHPASGAFQYT